MKSILLIMALLAAGCAHTIHDVKVNMEASPQYSAEDLAVLKNVNIANLKKIIAINVSSSVKGTEEEREELKCLLIEKFQKNGWEVFVTPDECQKCKENIIWWRKNYECQPAPAANEGVIINVRIVKLHRVSRFVRFLVGNLAGKAEIVMTVGIDVSSQNREINIVRAEIDAHGTTTSWGLGAAPKSMTTGNTSTAIEEAVGQIFSLGKP